MSWLGSWVGAYLGSWLGRAGVPPTVIAVSPILLSLSVPSPVVATGAIATPVHADLSLTLTAPTLTNGASVNPTALLITSTLPVVAVVSSSNLPVSPLQLTVSQVAALASGGAKPLATPLLLNVDSTVTSVYTGAIASVSAVDLQLAIVEGVVTSSNKLYPAPITLLIDIADAKVYDKDGAITYVTGLTMRANIPEIIAFSTDITTDMMVIDAMGDDMAAMDGTQSVKLLRKTDNIVISLVDGTAIPENKIYTFEHALIRQIADRDNRAVKQLRMFMQSVQNDDFNTMDTIIELPIRDDVQILTGDIIQSDLQGTKYDVIAVDTCTLKTRWRVGARKFV